MKEIKPEVSEKDEFKDHDKSILLRTFRSFGLAES